MSDLASIIPEANLIHIGGKDIEIKTMKVKQLSATVRSIQPFVSALGKNGLVNVDVPNIIMSHTDNVVELVQILTGEDKAWVEELGIDELVIVFTKLVEVNLDFFTRKVLPLLSVAMVKLTGNVREKEAQTPTGPSSSST
jgi:hypothetical protein